jgi:hypothetical protein
MDPSWVSAIASVCAVVVSILFLARQLRNGTAALKVATYQSNVATTNAILSNIFSNPEFADLQLRAHQRPEALSEIEKLRWDNYMLSAIRHFDSLYFQRRVGTLDDDMWQGYKNAFAGRLKIPVWRDWFAANQSAFSEPLVELVREMERGSVGSS